MVGNDHAGSALPAFLLEVFMKAIGGVSIQTLAETYGTPLCVYDEEVLRQKLSAYASSFRSDALETGVLYASKAFSCKAIVSLAKEYELGLDVVSQGEMYTALAAGFDPANIYFHGNNKTPAELDYAIAHNIGTIVVDNLAEAELLADKMSGQYKTVRTLLRINPGVEAHTHHYIATAYVDSKFGISLLHEDEIIETIRTLQKRKNIIFDGIHAHIGSQIFDTDAFGEEIRKMFAFADRLNTVYGIPVQTVNLGGGFAAAYLQEDHPTPVPEMCRYIISRCEEENKKLKEPVRKVLIEPGRSIVAEAGFNIYTAGYIKKTPGKTYAFADGGMNDNIRPALYQAKYDAFIAGKEEQEKTTEYTIAGKCCESGDILIDSIKLPEIQTGDLLVLKSTGAYGYSMASHYNKIPLPAVVFAAEGKSRIVIQRETFEHLISLEI